MSLSKMLRDAIKQAEHIRLPINHVYRRSSQQFNIHACAHVIAIDNDTFVSPVVHTSS